MNVTCTICGKEIPIEEAEAVNLGRRTSYKCWECVKNGNKELQKHKVEYFYHSYEGQRRIENSRKKRRSK